jgi:signal peptidase II
MKGQVIDWIELPHWPIFNLADSSIVIAAVLASYLSIRNIAPLTKDARGGDQGDS